MGRLRWMQNVRTSDFEEGELLQSDKYFYIRDAGIYIRSSADGTLDIVSDTTLNLTAPSIVTTGAITNKRPVISGSGATVDLTAAQTGSLVLFDKADGIVFTLPTPVAGLWYDFFTTTTITSNAAEVITKTVASEFILGSLINIDTDTSNAVAAWTGDGTTHVKISSNGSTTGGVAGSMYRLTAVSTTQWMVQGTLFGTGDVVTPFATAAT